MWHYEYKIIILYTDSPFFDRVCQLVKGYENFPANLRQDFWVEILKIVWHIA